MLLEKSLILRQFTTVDRTKRISDEGLYQNHKRLKHQDDLRVKGQEEKDERRMKNKRIKIEGTYMDYVSFGQGDRTLIMIPGIGDGLKTVKGLALPFSLRYWRYAKKFKVYLFSRKQKMEEGCTTQSMAGDLAKAMESLGIRKADIVGISQGGMIAQFLAIEHPELVNRLVLAVTSDKPGPILKHKVPVWVNLVQKNQFEELMTNIVKGMYSPAYFRRYGHFCSFMARIAKKADKERFCAIAKACVTHNTSDQLERIQAKTLVIGAAKDRVVGVRGSRELAKGIRNSRLIIYKNGEHGVYDETVDVHRRIIDFLKE